MKKSGQTHCNSRRAASRATGHNMKHCEAPAHLLVPRGSLGASNLVQLKDSGCIIAPSYI